MNISKRVIIVSNRLPIKVTRKEGVLNYQKSEGGLATALSTIYKQGNNLWIGWAGTDVNDSEEEKIIKDLSIQNLSPVFLSSEEINGFYEGFSNGTLWPLFHYCPTYGEYSQEYWQTYKRVNQKFADIIIETATKDDIIWIHDYQLMLVPSLVRKSIPEANIGFFQHIPFPSYEIFRLLPWRKELLEGLLGADIVGFHTFDDVRHFLSSVNRISGFNNMSNKVRIESRIISADAFPISIDYKKYRALADNAITKRHEQKIRQLINNNQLIISIDRLDYSKGILQRLEAYQIFLQQHPELIGRVTMMQVIVPSRDSVPKYRQLKEEINRLVSEINGQFSIIGWQPIQYFYRSLPIHLLSALYKVADVALVTPMRDGMNLVSKEFVASKLNRKGVLILSEMAGSARELTEAILVNPNDIWDVANKIFLALNMSESDQIDRMTAMQHTVSQFDIETWLQNFMEKLLEVKTQQKTMMTRSINISLRKKISISYFNSTNRIIFLDYDGTLVPFTDNPQQAAPDSDLIDLLSTLAHDTHNRVVLSSGRDYQTLENWFGQLPIDIIAEHGAWYKEHGTKWCSAQNLSDTWKPEIIHIMNQYNRRTPGVSIEEKSYSVAWHFRKVVNGLGELRAAELVNEIKDYVSDRGLQALQGDKVIEIKSSIVNKGSAAKRWIEQGGYDFFMAIGDDYTDEDTFNALPPESITIKVGTNISAARYYLKSHEDVRELLQQMQLCHSNERIT
ncbi:MAG: bifunctional alpha,alpha-trehalose-phosphate synthase (UDP-forming)/trehalose-phosphatase [Bacteroidetes bacterium]|nr:bifunctional alpha,alpha-trehalose-phosphate synthase (UDP-forming)/trehalose-phosphatase [Bacteroidota bacterium]